MLNIHSGTWFVKLSESVLIFRLIAYPFKVFRLVCCFPFVWKSQHILLRNSHMANFVDGFSFFNVFFSFQIKILNLWYTLLFLNFAYSFKVCLESLFLVLCVFCTFSNFSDSLIP